MSKNPNPKNNNHRANTPNPKATTPSQPPFSPLRSGANASGQTPSPNPGNGVPNPAPEATNPNPDETKTRPMSNAISKAGAAGDGQVLAVPQQPGDDIFNSVANGGKYLPRIQMFGGNSEAVKSGKVPMAHYALVTGKDQYQDLGDTVDCVPIAWRPKAMDVGGEEVISRPRPHRRRVPAHPAAERGQGLRVHVRPRVPALAPRRQEVRLAVHEQQDGTA